MVVAFKGKEKAVRCRDYR